MGYAEASFLELQRIYLELRNRKLDSSALETLEEWMNGEYTWDAQIVIEWLRKYE
jgi:hypothetical protein